MLMKHIAKEMEIQYDKMYLWSDSKVALQWIKSNARLPIFIQNRVLCIKNNAPRAILRHVPSAFNPADVGSRGSSIEDLLGNELWWNGPPFLKQNDQHWPEDKKNHHTGIAQTLTTLREHVWIPQGRAEVKRIINKLCMYCKREKAPPFRLPPFPDHPQERVKQPHYPFYNCAIDYAGPFKATINEEEVKVWIALFTCINTRAIHVDAAKSLSANCFLQILRRFISTHGCPHWILSDNASAFTSVANTIQTIPINKNNALVDYCSQHNIHFKFIPAFAPWQGGIYESMVKIFKKSLKATIRNRKLDFDEFLTMAKECEAIVNTRPLTYVYSDIDSGYPLRPIDFLRPFALLGSPRIKEEDESDEEWKTEVRDDDLQMRWKSTLELLNKFWKKWHEEYLTSMRERFQQEHRQPRSLSKEVPGENQIVIVHDSMKQRGQWKLARIIKRSDHCATLKLADGQTITRPFNLLYPLEIPACEMDLENDGEERTMLRDTMSNMKQQDPKTEQNKKQQVSKKTAQRTHPMITRSLKRNVV
ncbi:hypothetical protein OSTOST_02650 [Ostertagia ostertagi]